MAASLPSLDASEPKAPSAADRASDTDRPPALPPSIASAASDARLQAALSATSRADASLSTLMRAVRELTNGVSSAREANVALVGELGALADLLGAANERQLALKNRIAFLEQALTKARSDATSERTYILDQQDAFIAGMLEDHEHVVAELNRELDQTRERLSQRPTSTGAVAPSFVAAAVGPASTPPPATDPNPPTDPSVELEAARTDVEKLLADRERTRETLLKLQAQRDEAQAAVVRLTRERDLARSEGAQNRIGDAMRQAIPSHTPAPTPAGRMATTLPPPDSPRTRPPSSSPRAAVPSAKPASSRRRTDPGVSPPVVLENKSTRTTAPMPVGMSRPRAPTLDLPPREQRSMSPPPEELRAAIHPPTTPFPPAPVLTPAPITPRGPEVRLGQTADLAVPTAPAPASGTVPPVSKKGKPEQSIRPAGGYSMTNSVAPEQINTSGVSRPPRR